MNLEPVIQSEGSQKQTQISFINAYIQSMKIVLMNPSAGQEQRHRCREQTCGHSRGMRGWGELREQH